MTLCTAAKSEVGSFTCFLWPCAWSRPQPSWREWRWTGRCRCLRTGAWRRTGRRTTEQRENGNNKITEKLFDKCPPVLTTQNLSQGPGEVSCFQVVSYDSAQYQSWRYMLLGNQIQLTRVHPDVSNHLLVLAKGQLLSTGQPHYVSYSNMSQMHFAGQPCNVSNLQSTRRKTEWSGEGARGKLYMDFFFTLA